MAQKDKLPPKMCFGKKCTQINKLLPQCSYEAHVPETVCRAMIVKRHKP